MKTYQFLWRMIRYRPLLYTGNAILWALIHLSPLIPGLILQQFFNTLPASTHLNPDVWLLVALLVATALARCILMLGGALTDIPHRFIMNALLQRNLLERILERPGARAVPDCRARPSAVFAMMPSRQRTLSVGRSIRSDWGCSLSRR